jgi:D-alanine-D-alanine ligase
MGIKVDPDWWKSLFDELYLVTDARTVGDGEITRREVDLYSALLPLETSDRLLDLCGGQGRHSLEFCRRGYARCTVLDYSGYLVERGKAAVATEDGDVEFIQGDAVATGLPDASFEHVLILGNSIGYLPRKEDDRRIVKEACRLLRPGGWLLVDVADGSEMRRRFNSNAWHAPDDDIIVCRQRELDGDCIRSREVVLSKRRGLLGDRAYAIRLYLPEELAGMITAAGFRSVRIHRDLPLPKGEGDRGYMNHRVIVTARKGSR